VGVIDPVTDDNYSRNTGFTLDTDFTLMLRCGAHRLASVLEYGAIQTRVWIETRSWWPPHL